MLVVHLFDVMMYKTYVILVPFWFWCSNTYFFFIRVVNLVLIHKCIIVLFWFVLVLVLAKHYLDKSPWSESRDIIIFLYVGWISCSPSLLGSLFLYSSTHPWPLKGFPFISHVKVTSDNFHCLLNYQVTPLPSIFVTPMQSWRYFVTVLYDRSCCLLTPFKRLELTC